MEFRCTTCKVSVLAKTNFVKFDCPACGRELITRYYNCKKLNNKYTCKACGFTGP